MNKYTKLELLEHMLATAEECADIEELHFHAFNESMYIIGHYQCEVWLNEHDVTAFDAIEKIIEWENEIFGEVTLKPEDINPERVTNLYVYVLGEELCNEVADDDRTLVIERITDLIKEAE